MSETNGTTARHLVAEGRVQGVFFRASTRERANEHDLVGWVRNNADGTVEFWLEGGRDAVEAVERWIRDGGPPSARVENVRAEDEPPAGHDSFEVRR